MEFCRNGEWLFETLKQFNVVNEPFGEKMHITLGIDLCDIEYDHRKKQKHNA